LFSGWDVYRSEFPLLCLITPETVNDEVNSLLKIAKFKKELIAFDLVSHTKNNQIWIERNEDFKKKVL